MESLKAAPLTKTVFSAVAHLRAFHRLRTQKISCFRTATDFRVKKKNVHIVARVFVCSAYISYFKRETVSVVKVTHIENVNNCNRILITTPTISC